MVEMLRYKDVFRFEIGENVAPKTVMMRAGTVIGEQDGAPVTILSYMQAAGLHLDAAGQGFRLQDEAPVDAAAPAYGFEWKYAAIPYDPRLCANRYAESRQGRICIDTSLPVRAEDRVQRYHPHISIAETTIPVVSRRVLVAPSMAVAADVKTGDRRAITFFLSPLLRYADESLRER